MIVMEDKLKAIKQVILDVASKHGVEVDRIILFGSRARGDYSEDSDWDILVVTREKLGVERKMKFWHDVYRRFGFPVDIIVVSKRTFDRFKDSKGFIYSYAVAQGKRI